MTHSTSSEIHFLNAPPDGLCALVVTSAHLCLHGLSLAPMILVLLLVPLTGWSMMLALASYILMRPLLLLTGFALLFRYLPPPALGPLADRRNKRRFEVRYGLWLQFLACDAQRWLHMIPVSIVFHRMSCPGIEHPVVIQSVDGICDHRNIFIGAGSFIAKTALLIAHCTARPGAMTTIGTITIGRNVLIGPGAIVWQNVTIGDGAVVAAGSMVPPGTIIPPGGRWPASTRRRRRDVMADRDSLSANPG